MEYIKINGSQYGAIIHGYVSDKEWDKRDSKAITLEITYEEALSTFVDNVPWSIVHQHLNENNEIITEEYDNSEYCVAGSITDHRNGYVTVKMGKPTEIELLNKQLANSITEEELNTAYVEGVNSL